MLNKGDVGGWGGRLEDIPLGGGKKVFEFLDSILDVCRCLGRVPFGLNV